MIELHGWITIRESYEPDNDEDNIDNIVEKIEESIEKLCWQSDLIKLEYYNGIPSLTISLFKNRYNQEVKEAFELLNYIAAIAVGSYGMIYLYDDENTQGKENVFQVFALAKGKVNEYEDTFLSPIIPKIEDAI